jgi:hypothetical protein
MPDASTKPLAYKITQAAVVSGRSRTRIFGAIKNKELTARKDGRATIIFDDELRRWLSTFPIIGRTPDAAA